MLKCRLVEDGAALNEIGNPWDDLASRCEFVNVFALAGFARAWWRAFAPNRRLHVVVVEDGPEVRLIAPFYSDDARPGVWRLIGDFGADYLNLIFADGDVESLVCLLGWLRGQGRWNSLILRRLPVNAAVLDQFPRAFESGSRLGKRLAGLLDARFPLALKRQLREHPLIGQAALPKAGGQLEQPKYRRAVRQLGRNGALQFETVFDGARIRERLPTFMDQHVALWKSKGDRSQFLDRDQRDFFVFLTEELCASGAVRLDTLTLDGKLIAGHFGFTWRNRLHYYKPCFDVAVSSHPGPGTLLLAYIFQRACAEGLDEADLGQGNEGYKAHYASDTRGTAALLVRRSRLQTAVESARCSHPGPLRFARDGRY